MDHEHELTGGNATAGVVRVNDPTLGPTVRKPWLPHSALVQNWTEHLRSAGIDVPRSFGRDARGRAVTEFVPGDLALNLPPLSIEGLSRIGRLLRAIHDASEQAVGPDGLGEWPTGLLPPPEPPTLICHNDATPWNLVIQQNGVIAGDRWVFIDWDGAGPSTRAWDLAYSAQAFAGLGPDQSPDEGASRLRAIIIEGYAADARLREELPSLLATRARAMYDLLERSHREHIEPWGSMFVQGHGDHWRGVAEHCAAHEDLWRQWLQNPT